MDFVKGCTLSCQITVTHLRCFKVSLLENLRIIFLPIVDKTVCSKLLYTLFTCTVPVCNYGETKALCNRDRHSTSLSAAFGMGMSRISRSHPFLAYPFNIAAFICLRSSPSPLTKTIHFSSQQYRLSSKEAKLLPP